MVKELKYIINDEEGSVVTKCETETTLDDIAMIIFQNLVILKEKGLDDDKALDVLKNIFEDVYEKNDFYTLEEILDKEMLN